MDKLIDFLWAIVHPGFWLMNYPYSKEWDEWMKKMLDVGKFTDIGPFTAKLNGVWVWINNYPYAAFTNYPGEKCRPARRTIAKLKEKLIHDMIENQSN